ncbi:hypothetical protein FRX31_026215, partial [Thalictrum thalictroides]
VALALPLLGLKAKAKETVAAETTDISTITQPSVRIASGIVSNEGILGPPPGGTGRFDSNVGSGSKSQENTQAGVGFNSAYGGRAETWFQSAYQSVDRIDWLEFSDAIRSRFSTEAQENIVGDFNKLKQVTTVIDYQDKFEELKALLLLENKHLTEKYFVDSFISGLKDEIKHQELPPVHLEISFPSHLILLSEVLAQIIMVNRVLLSQNRLALRILSRG